MNRWIGTGRLTAEPDISTSQNGMTIAKYRMAVNRDRKKDGKNEADFINCVAFGKTADFVRNYLHKGTKILVEGRIQTGSYEKDGVKHYTFDIIVDRHEFCETRNTQELDYLKQERNAIQNEPTAGFTKVDDDDELPF